MHPPTDPWTREELTRRFGERPVFAMVHLQPLPGAPLFRGSLDEVIAFAVRDAEAIATAEADGFVVENFGDRPFRKGCVDPITIAAMSTVIAALTRAVRLPFGVNVLRNDAAAALAIARASGASFIRVNVHTGAMLTDQGIIEGSAAETLRLRRALGSDAGIVADHLVKHAHPLAPVDSVQAAGELRLRGLADAIVLTGRETGEPADPSELAKLREAIEAPIFVGSGVTAGNASLYSRFADAIIVGTSVKLEGDVSRQVDVRRLEQVVAAFKKGRSAGGRS